MQSYLSCTENPYKMASVRPRLQTSVFLEDRSGPKIKYMRSAQGRNLFILLYAPSSLTILYGLMNDFSFLGTKTRDTFPMVRTHSS